jgi:hypothetical protein
MGPIHMAIFASRDPAGSFLMDSNVGKRSCVANEENHDICLYLECILFLWDNYALVDTPQ